jgi:hypothetical protein
MNLMVFHDRAYEQLAFGMVPQALVEVGAEEGRGPLPGDDGSALSIKIPASLPEPEKACSFAAAPPHAPALEGGEDTTLKVPDLLALVAVRLVLPQLNVPL